MNEKKRVKVGTPFPWWGKPLDVVNVTGTCVTVIEPKSHTGLVIEDEELVHAVVKWCANNKIRVPVID